MARSLGNFVTHEDANFFQLLPFPIESEECADFEIAGSDVKRAGNPGPVVKVFQSFPGLIAIIDDEKLAAGSGRSAHGIEAS